MSRADKSKAVADLTERFRSATGVVLTEYRGISVAGLRELRESLRGNAEYLVVKNTLTKIAVEEAGVEGIGDMLVGPNAIAFITGDPVEASKGLKNFGKENAALVVKGGLLDGKPLSPEEISKLADLESREVLLAKLAGAMKASMSGAAAMFAAPLSQAARTLGALQAKATEDPSILAGAGEADPEAAATETTDGGEPAEEDTTTSADDQSADAEAPAEAQQEG
jgi:large subunit ribosomal protein L10